jgi:hypothetical protein
MKDLRRSSCVSSPVCYYLVIVVVPVVVTAVVVWMARVMV